MTGLGLTDKVCTGSKKDILLAVSESMNKSRDVKSKFIKMFISLDSRGDLPVDSVRAAVISQIKMVWEYHGMCSYRLMDEMIFTDSPVLGIETIAREALCGAPRQDGHTLSLCWGSGFGSSRHQYKQISEPVFGCH